MSLGDWIRDLLDPPAARRSGGAAVEVPPAGPPVRPTPSGRARTDAAGLELSVVSLDPTVRSWLARELPRLRDEGLLSADQAERIGHRYGIPSLAQAAATGVRATGAVTPGAGAAPGGALPRTGQGRPPSGPASGPALAPFLSEHAISIVLYLGAFLVVAAVIIYLGYNWGRVGGAVKLGALLGLTIGFFAAAGICVPRASVRLAGQTFLALGAILVPANVAAAYAFVFAEGPLAQAAFWLLGAGSAGVLYGALSVRLDSRAYGALATLAVPVAAAALATLVGLSGAWWAPAAELALVPFIAAADSRPRLALAAVGRGVACALLPLGALVSISALGWAGVDRWAASVGLLVMALATGREAIRHGGLWAAGPLAACLLLPLAALAAAEVRPVGAYAVSLAATSWIYVLVARRLAEKPALFLDLAGAVVSWLPPLLVWNESGLVAGLLAATALLFAAIGWARQASVLLYPALLAADLAFVRLVGTFGAPDSPAWRLGAVLWPLGLVWWGAAAASPRHRSHPFWAAALLTGAAAAALAVERPELAALMAGSFAVASALATWRLAEPVGLVACAPWLMLAVYQAVAWGGFGDSARLAAVGLAAWPFVPFFGVRGRMAPPATTSPDGKGRTRPIGDLSSRLRLGWADAARWVAAGVAGLASLALLEARSVTLDAAGSVTDVWLMLGAIALAGRSRTAALGAALALVPAFIAGIARTHATDAQAYALPIGLYLLTVAHLARRGQGPGRAQAASGMAILGVVTLLAPGLVQSLDGARLDYALLSAVEGLALAVWGIATRWRPLVAGGVSAIVAVALRQLFDAVHALPSWVILGGAGLALLAGAVALLLLRDRLRVAGRVVSDRWSSWD